MNKTFVIAEAGANHDRKFNQALKLVNLAVVSGCDAVKFQTYSSETLYRKNTPDFAGYKDVNNLIKEIELPREWQPQLKSYCDYKGIEFMSTPFDEEAVEELVGIGVSRLKISGFESTDFRFIEMVASSKLPLGRPSFSLFMILNTPEDLDTAHDHRNAARLSHKAHLI